jgi:hypothetical protein
MDSLLMLRDLGSLEKRFWLLDQNNASHIVLAAEIEGRTGVEDWRGALDLVQSRHPFCCAFIRANGGTGPAFFRNADASIPLRIIHDRNPAHWTKVVESELATPFDTERAPLLRTTLLHRPERSVLVLSAHPTISDGVSLSFLVRDIVRALANEQLHPLPTPRSIDQLTRSSADPSAGGRNRAPLHAARNRHSPRPASQRIPSVDRLQMSPGFTSKLCGRSKEEGTTIDGALCASLVVAGRVISEQWRQTTVRVLYPVNIRKLAGIDEDFGLYTTSTLASFEPQTTAGFWNLARFTSRGLAVPVSLQNLADQTGALKKVFDENDWDAAAEILSRRTERELMLVNLGRIPFETCIGALRVSSIWGPLALSGHPGEHTVGVVTTNNALSILSASRDPFPGLLDHAARILAGACEHE